MPRKTTLCYWTYCAAEHALKAIEKFRVLLGYGKNLTGAVAPNVALAIEKTRRPFEIPDGWRACSLWRARPLRSDVAVAASVFPNYDRLSVDHG